MKRNASPVEVQASAGTVLSELQRLVDFQRAHAAIFPSLESARWFMREHRAELVRAGAIVFINRRAFVYPRRFAKVALRAGVAAARRELVDEHVASGALGMSISAD